MNRVIPAGTNTVIEPIVIWDLPDEPEGNVAHIEEHGVTQDEVEEVVQNPNNPTVTSDNPNGRPITFGYTSSGRYLAVVWEHVDDDPRTIKPVTAYDAPEPRPPRKKKRRR